MTTDVVLNGMVQGVLLLSALVAWPFTWLLLRAYRRRVDATMRRSARVERHAGHSERHVPPPPPPSPTTVDIASTDPAEDHGSRGAVPDGRDLVARSSVRRAAVLRRYVYAGGTQALVLAFATLASAGIPIVAVRIALLWVTFMWPIVLTIAVLWGFDRRAVGTAVALYLSVLVAVGAAGGWAAGALVLWAAGALPATLVTVPYLHRSVRAVGVVVLLFTFVSLMGAGGLTVSVGSSSDLVAVVDTAGGALGVDSRVTAVVLVALGLLPGAGAGWWALRWFGRAYRDHGLPDDLVLAGTVWTLFGVAGVVPLAFESIRWVAVGVLGPAAFWSIALRPVRHGAGTAASRLLLLRVFAGDRRTERLYRRLTAFWQHVGPVRLIGGPDLARATVEPDAFLRFVAGRLDELFVTEPSQADSRARSARRDRHARHRVQELLCFDDTWKEVVERLARDTDLVLMDLRGLDAGTGADVGAHPGQPAAVRHAGVRHELSVLTRRRLLGRTVLIVDRSTDLAAVDSVIEGAGGRMSDVALTWQSDQRRVDLRALLRALPTSPSTLGAQVADPAT